MNHFKTRKVGWNQPSVVTAMTSSTGRHTPVIDLGGLSLTSILVSTVGWTDADITINGGVNTTSTAAMKPLYGSILGGSLGSTLQVIATFETTASRVHTIDPRLTAGISHIMLQGNATQDTTRAITLGLT